MARLRSLPALLAVGFAIGCGAAAESPASPTSATPTSATPTPTHADGALCANPTPVIVPRGGTITRPKGSALRLQLVYQGAAIGVTQVRGVDMVLAPSGGPFVPGKAGGYWVESRSSAALLYQVPFRDPTVREAPGAPGGGGFSNSTIDRCEPKIILADVPNDSSASELRVYGSPYGTVETAVELARFELK